MTIDNPRKGDSVSLVPALDDDARRNDLGDITQVIRIVNQFVDDVLAEVVPLEELCRKMARVFIGREPGFTPLAAWNTPSEAARLPGLIRHLTEQIQGLPNFPNPEQTVATAFG